MLQGFPHLEQPIRSAVTLPPFNCINTIQEPGNAKTNTKVCRKRGTATFHGLDQKPLATFQNTMEVLKQNLQIEARPQNI